MSQEPVPVPADMHKSWIERIETARDNVVEILKGNGGDPALPELLKERLLGAADQMRDIAAVDHTYRVPQSTFRDCHNRCRTAELPMNLVPGLTQEQKEIGVGLRNVANEMLEIGNLYGMGLT